MPLFLSIYPLGLLAFFIHLFKTPRGQRTTARIIELFLLYQLVFSVGITSLFSFVGLSILDKYIAELTHWPWCPFEQQLANVNLAFGTLGILCIWYRGLFWMATVLGFSIWIFADGLHHLYEYFYFNNTSEGNIGVPLYTDMIIPPILIALLYFYLKENKRVLKYKS